MPNGLPDPQVGLPLFLYGSLRYEPLLQVVLGPTLDCDIRPAKLTDHADFASDGLGSAAVSPAAGSAVDGILLTDLAADAQSRLAFYGASLGFSLRPVTVQVEGIDIPAQTYWPDVAEAKPGAPWDLQAWRGVWGNLALVTAEEIMTAFGVLDPRTVAPRLPSIRVRAQARINARETAPTALRKRAVPSDVTVQNRITPYAGFFAIEEYDLTHSAFRGGHVDPIERAIFVSGDAATILPYDPNRDRVLLIEQFRPGAMARGDSQPWLLEAIAGRVDPGETPQQAARREAQEEAGLALTELIPIGGYYPSPGAMTEYLYSFIGVADLPDHVAGVGGLDTEGEDIRSHVIPFKKMMDLLQSGEIANASLIVSALHLARLRDTLRSYRQGPGGRSS